MLQKGFYPSTIEIIIQAGSESANSFGFLLLEKEFSSDDILKLINRTNTLPWEKRYIYQQIMINKPKTETDIFLRINYAEIFINLPELQDVKIRFCIDCIIDAANFAIINNIPAKDFIDEFFPKTEENWTPFQLYDIFSKYMKQHIPYLSDLSLSDNNERKYEDKEISFASEMQAFIKAQRKLNNRTGQKHYITFSDVPMYYRKINLNAKYLSDTKAYEENCDNKDHINYLRNEFPKRLNWTDEECYADMKSRFNKNMVDSNGNLLSTYNPNSKWDYYSIGGGWNNCIKTLNGEQVNEAYVNEVDWKESTPFAFISPTGEWHEKGQMGWWAMVSNEKKKKDWEAEFKEFIDGLDKNTMVTAVDCHI